MRACYSTQLSRLRHLELSRQLLVGFPLRPPSRPSFAYAPSALTHFVTHSCSPADFLPAVIVTSTKSVTLTKTLTTTKAAVAKRDIVDLDAFESVTPGSTSDEVEGIAHHDQQVETRLSHRDQGRKNGPVCAKCGNVVIGPVSGATSSQYCCECDIGNQSCVRAGSFEY